MGRRAQVKISSLVEMARVPAENRNRFYPLDCSQVLVGIAYKSVLIYLQGGVVKCCRSAVEMEKPTDVLLACKEGEVSVIVASSQSGVISDDVVADDSVYNAYRESSMGVVACLTVGAEGRFIMLIHRGHAQQIAWMFRDGRLFSSGSLRH
ncbi:unnamed protein product [Polarella glacialis]|uniref:Uncharacterized protein n=1 Tax=Polarella glacialis TaxID=89957 RepID=A0A813JV70_POLGL|nr:unnamed protein product [Polarella glacialis]